MLVTTKYSFSVDITKEKKFKQILSVQTNIKDAPYSLQIGIQLLKIIKFVCHLSIYKKIIFILYHSTKIYDFCQPLQMTD